MAKEKCEKAVNLQLRHGTICVKLVKEKTKVQLIGDAAVNAGITKCVVVKVAPDVTDINVGAEVILDPLAPHFKLDDKILGAEHYLIGEEAVKATLE